MLTPKICLMGPTAAGKTALALKLTDYFPLDIISVDSAMIYRGMDIGTAKPSRAILEQIPHRLIDICDPSDAYSVAAFCNDAGQAITEIESKQRIPFLVGGTMMYFHALGQGITPMPSANAEIRLALTEEGNRLGWPHVHHRLQGLDPVAAARIHPQDKQRIQRALEVYLMTGKPLSEFHQENKQKPSDLHYVIIAPTDRSILHHRIAVRFHEMLEQGWVNEVEKLIDRPDLNSVWPSLRTVGYRQIIDYLAGNFSYETMCEKGIIATRQIAKRQLTWLRSFNQGQWFEAETPDLLSKVVRYLQQVIFIQK